MAAASTKDQPPKPSKGKGLHFVAILTRVGVALGMLLVAGAIFGALVSTRPVPPRTAGDIAPPRVRFMTAQAIPVRQSWVGYGQARAMRAVGVPALVGARVIERPAGIEDGVWVDRGDLLLRLEPDDFANLVAATEQRIASLDAQLQGLTVERERLQQQVELAQDEANLARAELERVQQAVEQRAGTTTDIETRLSALSRAERVLAGLEQQVDLIPARRASLEAQILAEQAQLATGRLQLERSTITAPISGYLQFIGPETGEFVPAGTIVARVVDPTLIEVPLRVPSSAVALLVPGDRVELAVEGPAGAAAVGTIARIAPEAEAQTRSATVFVEITQELAASRGGRLGAVEGFVLPGQVLTARLIARETEPRVVVPRRVVADDRVLVVRTEPGENGEPIHRVQQVDVRVLYTIELPADNELLAGESQWAVLASGVEPGERVVVSNLDELAADNRADSVTSVLPRGRRILPIPATGPDPVNGGSP